MRGSILPLSLRRQPPFHLSWFSHSRGKPTPGLVSTLSNHAYSIPSREVQTFLQVTEQVWHPMHLSRFNTMPICALTFMLSPLDLRPNRTPTQTRKGRKRMQQKTEASVLARSSPAESAIFCCDFSSPFCAFGVKLAGFDRRPVGPSNPPSSSCARSRTRRDWRRPSRNN